MTPNTKPSHMCFTSAAVCQPPSAWTYRYMELFLQGMMAQQHLPLEAMEVEYDSDDTEVIDITLEGNEDDEGEEEEEGSITPSIYELDIEDVTSPQLGRRRRTTAAVAAATVAATTAASVHQPGNSEGEEADEEGSRSPIIQELSFEDVRIPQFGRRTPPPVEAAVQQQDSREGSQMENTGNPEIRRPATVQDADLEEEQQEIQGLQGLHSEAAAAEEPPQPEEPQHASSSSQGLHSPHPSPAPPPSVPPDNSCTQQQTTPPLSSQSQEARISVSLPEGAGPSVEASVSNPAEMLIPPAVAGPSTSVVPLSSTPKKQSADAAPAPPSPESEDEGQTCPICFDPWTNKGDHRLSSLKCGHLFGYECISKWLQGSTKRNRGKCPQCNAKVTKKDIRIIYAKNIKVLDTTEKEMIMKELEKEREEKRRLEVEHAQTKLKYELKSQLVVKLQEELKMLKASALGTGHLGVSSSKAGESSSLKKRLVFREWLDVCREGGCRVMAHNEWLSMLVVSMPSQVGMFPGYGVKKINLLDLRVDRYVPLHQKQIRDLAFNPAKHDLLLSVGMDRMVKITNICSNAPVAHFIASAPLWCCSWSTTEITVFYVGTASGHLQQYDTRDTSGPVATIELPGSGPAVSMTYIHPGPESSLTWGGLLVARLQSCFFVEAGMPGEAKSHQLPLDGTFTSVSCEGDTCHVLVSCRPSQRYPHARHAVCLLQQVTASLEEGGGQRRTVTTQPVHTFQGGTTQKVLTRSILTRPPFPGYSPLVCASDESTQSIYVWELSSMNCLQQLRYSDIVVDLLQVTIGETPHLVALTEKGVRLYRWDN
ncbi:E3 ubiquitin-protein ligase RFWD3-like isoform X2 [Scylla paramamosain]|uniref:E3 ubiquitin-protein ligase RFWD3-like isoform X2 n=1 Tax=Scylla paramamosain TaxID=85552 RepID=UPI003082AA52